MALRINFIFACVSIYQDTYMCKHNNTHTLLITIKNKFKKKACLKIDIFEWNVEELYFFLNLFDWQKNCVFSFLIYLF